MKGSASSTTSLLLLDFQSMHEIKLILYSIVIQSSVGKLTKTYTCQVKVKYFQQSYKFTYPMQNTQKVQQEDVSQRIDIRLDQRSKKSTYIYVKREREREHQDLKQQFPCSRNGPPWKNWNDREERKMTQREQSLSINFIAFRNTREVLTQHQKSHLTNHQTN